MRKRADKGQVEEQGENPVEEEVSRFVAIGNLVDEAENAKVAGIRKNDDEGDEEREKNRKPLQKKKETP